MWVLELKDTVYKTGWHAAAHSEHSASQCPSLEKNTYAAQRDQSCNK